MIKIAIFGQWRTGTTGMFYKIKNSLPPKTPVYFEPTSYKPPMIRRNTGYELAKVILGSVTESEKDVAQYNDFIKFDKKILIVRDPRDWIISGLLFLIQQFPEIYSNEKVLSEILGLLEQKEKSPESVSVVQIAELVLRELPNRNLEIMIKWIKLQHELVYKFEETLDDYYLIKYEDFVDGNIQQLQQYLGFELEGDAVVDDMERAHIPRTKSYGNWRDWYLKEDIKMFKPVFKGYLERYGYSDDWETNTERDIDPKHCSIYVKGTLVKRRKSNEESFFTKKIRELKYRLSYI